FEGENPQSVMMKRILSDPIPLDSVSPEINEAIARPVMNGLARDRDARTPTVEAFASALRTGLMSRTNVLGGRVTGRIDEDSTTEWEPAQTRTGSPHAVTEVAHSVIAPPVKSFETSNASAERPPSSSIGTGVESKHQSSAAANSISSAGPSNTFAETQ